MAEESHHIPALDATRGIAALMVAAYHCFGAPLKFDGLDMHLIAAASNADSLIERARAIVYWLMLPGDAAVMFFFVLSGFVLAISLSRAGELDAAAAFRFAARRACRVYPVVICAVMAFVVLNYAAGLAITHDAAAYSLPSILRNMLLIDSSINHVTWSMQAELIAAPVIFVCFAFASRGETRTLVILLLSLVVLSFNDDWDALFSVKGLSRTQPLYAFAAGVLAHAVGRELVEQLRPSHHGSALMAALAGFFGANLVFGTETDAAVLMQVAASALIVMLLAFGRWDALLAVLNMPSLRLMGRVSFSFYLLHPLAMVFVCAVPGLWTAIVAAGVPPTVVIAGLWVATTAAVLPLAILSHRYIEQPGIELGRAMTTRAAPADARSLERA